MASTSTRSELVKNLLLAFASVAGTLLVLELGVRLFAPVPLVASDLFLVTERKPEVRARTARRALKPDVRCRQTSSEYDVAVSINRQGLRDVPHSYAKPPHTTRILFLGDSFVFGYGVESSQRFTNLVQARLNHQQPGRPHYEVINAGVPSWGTTDELLWLREEGLKYHPDLVVLCFYENDIIDNYERDLFVLQGAKLVARSYGVPRETSPAFTPSFVTRDPFNDEVLKLTSGAPVTLRQPQAGFLVTHSHLARLVRQVVLTHRSGSTDERLEELEGERAASQMLSARLIDEVSRVSTAAGARFKLVLIPHRRSVERHRASSLYRFPVLLRWLQARPAGSTLDLIAGLGQDPNPRSLYFTLDRHLTARGHAVSADLIARFLKPASATAGLR